MNLVGLSIGIAACIIIFFYVRSELTYDLYNEKADRIVRITTSLHTPEGDIRLATSPYPLAPALKNAYAEVEEAVRLQQYSTVVKSNGEMVRESHFYQADPQIFSVFTFRFLEGSPATALSEPNSIVLTETTAKKYFGAGPALGKVIYADGKPLQVSGVVKNRPANSDIQIDALLSVNFSKYTSWMGEDFSAYTFVLFRSAPDYSKIARNLQTMVDEFVKPELMRDEQTGVSLSFEAEPLAMVHFSKDKLVDTPKGNRQFAYFFSVLAVFILFMALLNYINNSIIKSAERAREVGVRKVSGALPAQLISQFMFESLVLVAFAWLIAIGIAFLTLPFFNSILETKITFSWQSNFIFIVPAFIATVFLAGLYPAFVLSSFQPVKVLKGTWKHGKSIVLTRRILTGGQYVITIILITGTIAIFSQLRYLQKKDPGFNRDQVALIALPNDSIYKQRAEAFYQALRARPEVKGVTAGTGLQSDGIPMSNTIVTSGNGQRKETMCNYFFIDKDFLSVLKIPLAEGRNLSPDFGTDLKQGFLVNEAFVRKMGWKRAIDQPIEGFERKGKVVGVVRDFYYKSFHNFLEPLVMVYDTVGVLDFMVKINEKDMAGLKSTWTDFFPDQPFAYEFLDTRFNAFYRKDVLTMNLFNCFTFLAIIISCLGLYSLISLIAIQRTKEMGIRKVLGASLLHIIFILVRDFLKIILIAAFIGLPVAGYFVYRWLSSYAYHVQMAWWMFLLPLLLVLLISLLITGREVLRAAVVNPVDVLRAD